MDRRIAQKNLDLIALLQSSVGPEKWIFLDEGSQLGVYHAPRFKGRRAIPQVLIGPAIFIEDRRPLIGSEIKYLLPVENRLWEYVRGSAPDAPTAAAMVIEALGRCEQRDEHLYEPLA
jgi:hypothetical protein